LLKNIEYFIFYFIIFYYYYYLFIFFFFPGAAAGIGKAIVLRLLALGYRVAAVDFNESSLKTLKGIFKYNIKVSFFFF